MYPSTNPPGRAKTPRRTRPERRHRTKALLFRNGWGKHLASARNVARYALQRLGGDLVPARKPHTRFSCVLSDLEAYRLIGMRAFEEAKEEDVRHLTVRPYPRYLRTLNPRWLIVFPPYFQSLRKGGLDGIRAEATLWWEREMVWAAAGVIEEIWCLRQSVKKKASLSSVISSSIRIGELCERLSPGHFLDHGVLRHTMEKKANAHEASVATKKLQLEQIQRPWANEVHELRRRIDLMAACRIVARRRRIGVRRMHQIYRKHFPCENEMAHPRS